jgi:hypothetical protein
MLTTLPASGPLAPKFGGSIQQASLIGRKQPSYVRRTVHTGIANKALWSISRWHPSWAGELAGQAGDLAAHILIIGVLPSTQDYCSTTRDEELGLATTHPKGQRPRLC